MGRRSDYKSESNDMDKIKHDAELIKNKIGKEPLTTEEIATYLSAYGNSQVGKKNKQRKPLVKKTVENYIKRICKDSEGLLEKKDFMSDDIFIIKPEFQQLLLTIIDTNYFDGRKNQRLLGYREELFRTLIKNIECYAQETDKKLIKDNPSYINAYLESELSKKLNNELTILLRNLYHSDPMVRFTMMKHVIEEFVRLNKWVSKTNSLMFSTKLVYGHEVEECADAIGKGGKYQKALFQADTLEEFIVKLLACKVHNKEMVFIDEEEKLTYPALFVAQKLYNIEIKDECEAKVALDKIDKLIADNDRFNSIKVKAEQILNLDDPYELLTYRALIDLSKVYFLSPYVDSKDYENTVKFTQSAMASNMWDMLNTLINMGKKSYSEDMIGKIENIQRGTEKNE